MSNIDNDPASNIAYVPIPPPPPKPDAGPPEPTAEEEGKYLKVYEHFTKDGYALPDEEEGELTEEETFWLVRFRYLNAPFLRHGTDGLRGTQSYECLLRWVPSCTLARSRDRRANTSSHYQGTSEPQNGTSGKL